MPVPYVDAKAAELLFRHKVIRFLREEGLLSEERIELLLSWQNTGFSVHNTVTVVLSTWRLSKRDGAPSKVSTRFQQRHVTCRQTPNERSRSVR